jgi:glycosyltransferase involved in cell wall biosynthesis
VPLGIDLGKFEKAEEKRRVLRDEIGAADGEILVGLVGRLTEIKNHPLFLKVAKLYKQNSSNDLPKMRFLIVGDGHLREPLEKEAADLGVADIVTFLGNRNDTDAVYAGLDIVALTSDNEGTPLSLIEAMATERSCISTSVGGVVDLLGAVKEEKESFTVCERGIRVAAGDAESFFKGLIYLAKDEKLRKETAERGRDFVFSHYSKERLIREIKELYSDLLQDKG